MNTLTPNIYHYLLSDWIEMLEIGKLDSAVCNSVEREQFLRAISRDIFILKSMKNIIPNLQLNG